MNYIDINDKNTYPKEFLDFCEKNKERLNNSITEELYMSLQSDLGQRIFKKNNGGNARKGSIIKEQ